MFIGRTKELTFLENAYKRKQGQLIFLYGRRRIGKTEVLKQFCRGKPHVFYSCQKRSDQKQLELFSGYLLRENIPAAKYVSSFSSWEDAFRAITELPYGEEKKLVIIDEFPYMCMQNEAIPSVLQNLWDHVLKNENLMIILCGSSMSYIEEKLLSEENPLYGRATGIYKMSEMDFYEAANFYPQYAAEELITTYAVLGGIPHYLKEFDDHLSLEENIKERILSKGCILYSEVDFLLHEELRETAQYNAVIEAVAMGNTELTPITQKALVPSTAATSSYLKTLMELGLVEKRFPVTVNTKQKANQAKGLYALKDNFFRFWYTFVFDNFSELEAGDVNGVYQYVIEPNLNQFVSKAFEEICIQYVQKLQQKQSLPFRYERLGYWEGKTSIRKGENTSFGNTEIDLLAISNKEKKYLVGECKYKNQPFSYSDYLDVVAKLGPEQEQNEFYYYLFSKNGFVSSLEEEAKKDTHIALCSLETIINP